MKACDIYQAICRADNEAIDYFLKKKAKLGELDKFSDGYVKEARLTVLMYAVMYGNIYAIRKCLKAGCNPNIRSGEVSEGYRNAFELACMMRRDLKQMLPDFVDAGLDASQEALDYIVFERPECQRIYKEMILRRTNIENSKNSDGLETTLNFEYDI